MFDIGSIFSNLDIGWNHNLDNLDLNHDGKLTIDDCSFSFGSWPAKLWVEKILKPYVTETGQYNNLPLDEGGRFQYLRDSIRISHGLSFKAASKVAGRIEGYEGDTGRI